MITAHSSSLLAVSDPSSCDVAFLPSVKPSAASLSFAKNSCSACCQLHLQCSQSPQSQLTARLCSFLLILPRLVSSHPCQQPHCQLHQLLHQGQLQHVLPAAPAAAAHTVLSAAPGAAAALPAAARTPSSGPQTSCTAAAAPAFKARTGTRLDVSNMIVRYPQCIVTARTLSSGPQRSFTEAGAPAFKARTGTRLDV